MDFILRLRLREKLVSGGWISYLNFGYVMLNLGIFYFFKVFFKWVEVIFRVYI